jgi:hypothetical protein
LIVWETLIIETKSKGYKTNRLARRKFLKTAAAAGCITATNLAFGRSSRSDKAEAFWPNPNDPNGRYINRDGAEQSGEHRKVMVALSIQMPALTAAWLLTGKCRYAQKACAH